MNLIEGLQEEIKRCRDLLEVYKEIGPAGRFAHVMILNEIEVAEKSIATGDVAAMIRSLEELRQCN